MTQAKELEAGDLFVVAGDCEFEVFEMLRPGAASCYVVSMETKRERIETAFGEVIEFDKRTHYPGHISGQTDVIFRGSLLRSKLQPRKETRNGLAHVPPD